MVLNLDSPKDVRELIKKFIQEMDEDGFQIPQPGAVANLLNVVLRCYEMEQEQEIVKRLDILEKKIQEVLYAKEERQKEREYSS